MPLRCRGPADNGLVAGVGQGVEPLEDILHFGDHVAAPDLCVASALGKFGQGTIVDRVGHAVADEIDAEGRGGRPAANAGAAMARTSNEKAN